MSSAMLDLILISQSPLIQIYVESSRKVQTISKINAWVFESNLIFTFILSILWEDEVFF